MNPTLVMLLAGGAGSRLNILGAHRAKPAVPFGGIYRIIDFTMSNAMNSGLNTVGVLTQYKPLSLMEHMGTGAPWDLIGRTRGVNILPPRTGNKNSDWYKGTADAVRQNIDFIESNSPKRIIILSGDHIYKMDYEALIAFHEQKKADLTIGMMTVPWEDTRSFGIAITGDDGRVVDWEEKPEKPRNNLASMGIYVFDTDYLLDALRTQPKHDFGHNIIPAAIKNDRVFAYPFTGYWRDVGTIKAYWEANMDLLNPDSGLNLDAWALRTKVQEEGRLGDRPPGFIASGATAKNCKLSPGCYIEGHIENSILSPGVIVRKNAVVRDSVVMHNCHINAGARIDHCILDKNVCIGNDAELGVGAGDTPNQENPDHLWNGLTLVGKSAFVPPRCMVGKNSIVHPAAGAADFKTKQIAPGTTVRKSVEKN